MQSTTRSPLRAAQERALAAGQHTFNINLPCPQGHLSPRYASNGNCSECAKLFRGHNKPAHERQLKLRTGNQRVTQISEDSDTIALVTLAKQQVLDLLGRPISTSLIHKAGIVLLADYLGGSPTAQTFRSLIK